MSWKCPECNSDNKDTILRCYCGYEYNSEEVSKHRGYYQKYNNDKSDKNIVIKIDLYINNSFRILGLPSNASAREIARREKEIIAHINIGHEYKSKYDFPWLGPLKRTEENIREASYKLQAPYSRLLEEIFWFTNNSPVDELALSALVSGDIDQARFIWSEAIKKSKSKDEACSCSFKNLILLEHMLLIQEEIASNNKKERLDERVFSAKWNELIKNWSFLINDESYFNLITKRAISVEEKRFSFDILQKIVKESIPEKIAQINILLLKSYLEYNKPEFVKIHGGILNTDLLKKQGGKGLYEILVSITNRINEICNTASTKLNNITNDLTSEDINKICDEAFKLIKDEATPLQNKIDLITLVVPNVISHQIIGKDTIAKTYNIISLRLNNSGNNIRAESILKEAINYAATDSLKELLNNNIKIVAKNAAHENFTQATINGKYDQAADYYFKLRSLVDKDNEEEKEQIRLAYNYYCKKRLGNDFSDIFIPKNTGTFLGTGINYWDKWDYDKLTNSYSSTRYMLFLNIPLIPLGRYRVVFQKDGSKKPIGQLSYGKLNGIHLILVIVLGIFLFQIIDSSDKKINENRYNYSSPTQPPTTYREPYQPPDSRSELTSSIAENKSRLSAMESELNNLKYSLKDLQSRIEELESDIQYGKNINTEVSFLIKEHNELVNSYNSKLKRFKELYAEYNNLLNETNAMIDEYNRNVRR